MDSLNKSQHYSSLTVKTLVQGLPGSVKVWNMFLFAVFWVPANVAATEWQIKPGESLSEAVRTAAAGDIMLVEKGYYVDHLVIDKAITLRGLNRPTISGNESGDVIRIKAPHVVVEGFIIRDSGTDLTAQNAGVYVEPGSHGAVVRHNDLTYNLFGLWIEKANEVTVDGNIITGKRDLQSAQRGNGIELYNTTGARILNNQISFTRDGIYVDVSHHAIFRGNKLHHLRYGTHYMNSYYNLWENNESYLNRGGLALMEVRNQTVRHNITWGNADHGIMLRTIQDSLIENNIVVGNGKGFFIYDAEYNIIRNNLVTGNRVGVHLWAGSYLNEVYDNDFIQNEQQIRYGATRDVEWGREKGNFWSNYTGWDRDGNGRGDVPYAANDIIDRLVWRQPYVKLLLNSPALQTLRLIGEQFPLLRAPSVVDDHPLMRPVHKDWSKQLARLNH
jgi:nitrous oxidase accessory protein